VKPRVGSCTIARSVNKLSLGKPRLSRLGSFILAQARAQVKPGFATRARLNEIELEP
jgi:hypothetical protein